MPHDYTVEQSPHCLTVETCVLPDGHKGPHKSKWDLMGDGLGPIPDAPDDWDEETNDDAAA